MLKIEEKQNVAYGVDIDDPKAVRRKFFALKFKHFIVTLFAFALMIVLAVPVLDFVRVKFKNEKPMIAVKKDILGGVLYKGLGYTMVYCDDAQKIFGGNEDSCITNQEGMTFTEIFKNSFMSYVYKNKIVDKDNLKSLDIISTTFDEKNAQGGSDYYVNFTYQCVNGKDNCVVRKKEASDKFNVNVYVSLDKSNMVYDIKPFKNSGVHYDELVKTYTDKLKSYLISHGNMNSSDLRSFEIKLDKNFGLFKYNDVTYEDSYLVSISYICTNDDNPCISNIDGVKFDNHEFAISMLLDINGEIAFVGKSAILS